VATNSDLIATPATVIATLAQPQANGITVEAFGLRTGSIRWERVASGVEPVPGGLLIYTQSASSGVVSRVDPDTGVQAWSITIPQGCAETTARDLGQVEPDAIVEFCVDTGRLSVIDLGSGRVTASRRVSARPLLGPSGVADPESQYRRVLFAGAVTLLSIADGSHLSISAFRTSDLVPLWSGLPMDVNDQLHDCAPDVCLDGNGDRLVIDPLTGHLVPAATTPRSPASGPGTLLVVPDSADYADMRAGDVPGNDTPVPAGTSAQVMDAGLGTIWIATWSASSIRLLQQLSNVETDSCVSIAGYIACATSFGHLTFWRRSSP
jgi:hypothetical protein